MNKYYLHEFNENDAGLLASFFLLTSDKLPSLGGRTENKEAALFWVIDIDSQAGLEFWRMAQHAQSNLIIAVSKHEFPEAVWLIKKPFAIYGVNGLLAVFSNLLEVRAVVDSHDLSGVQSPPVKVIRSADNPFFIALSEVLNGQNNVELGFQDDARILASTAAGKCWSNRSPRQWIKFFSHLNQVQQVSLEKLTEVQTNTSFHAYPIDTLKWCLALHLWQGEPSPAAATMKTFQLKCWPNFGQLPHYSKHLSITSYMLCHPIDMKHLVEVTNLPREFVQDFVNACLEAGLLNINPETNKEKKLIKGFNNPLKGLLKKLGVGA